MAQQATAATAAAEAERRTEVQRRMQPRSRADFLVLYDELAVWCGRGVCAWHGGALPHYLRLRMLAG